MRVTGLKFRTPHLALLETPGLQHTVEPQQRSIEEDVFLPFNHSATPVTEAWKAIHLYVRDVLCLRDLRPVFVSKKAQLPAKHRDRCPICVQVEFLLRVSKRPVEPQEKEVFGDIETPSSASVDLTGQRWEEADPRYLGLLPD